MTVSRFTKAPGIISPATRARRSFLKKSAAVAVLGSGACAMQGKLGLMGSALAAQGDYADLNDYRALVCVFLYGGSDSFNMYLPDDTGLFDSYTQSRGALAIERDAVLFGDGSAQDAVGFHPSLAGLRTLYDGGDLAILQNVGNLAEPLTAQQYRNGEKMVPADLFAHNHQQEQWQKGWSSVSASLVSAGWGGRIADLLDEANQGATLPPTFSLGGSNFWQPGIGTTPIAMNANNGLSLLSYLDSQASTQNIGREEALEQILALPTSHPLQQHINTVFSRAKTGSRAIREVLQNSREFTTQIDSGSRLAQQLNMVARMIEGREALNMKRQLFFVGMGGWDTHDNQQVRLELLMSELNRSLVDFQAQLGELGVTDQVTTFTASDFGRTLTTNGDGSDHGWGGHQIIIGGAVNGGRTIGDAPDYITGGDFDTGDKGRVIPSLSVNQYGASLAGWMGLSVADQAMVFPDLENFGPDWSLPVFS